MEILPDQSQSVIKCRNSQGMEVQANLLRLTRYSVVFEVYNPYSILQLSEVLSDFRILANKRLIYRGKAVVSNLLNTGLVLVCEASLEDGWQEVDFLSGVTGEADLGSQFAGFMSDWKAANKVQDAFKISVADMSSTLTGVQHWMGGIDVGIRSTATRRRDDLEREIFSNIQKKVIEEVIPAMESFEDVAGEISEEEMPSHKSYIRRELHPIVLCSPFLYRTYTKPLGYAGDYEMVNMMLRDPYEGASSFAKLLNYAMLNTEPVVAHRNRIDYLVDMLDRESSRRFGRGRARAFNLGCGPAEEVLRFLKDHDSSDLMEFDLLDFNPETLEYTRERLDKARMGMARNTQMRFIPRSVHQILKAAVQPGGDPELGNYDVVYCAGLFDYLSQRVGKRLVEFFCSIAKPGGLVVVTNVADSNPRKAWMEYLMEWNLIYRGKEEMLDLVPVGAPVKRVDVKADSTGVNLFLEIEMANG
ncbi:class I SAM-dependent methyltransferase [Luteolibacter luteus]|uniref:Class I SAM-dependent methyltransferase n=1 Tax=Luteolibacter luteus TaxID=2728835 RepID=A0A858REK9_9BACT|nr:class I SAM-dependent methyltransferase [Luteolibacter luteus]QJE95182.1 class I SAM-dependent methyltransferase [Luteolibacter luteus]